MSNKLLVLITGANQGLGFYAAQQMSATDKYHILMGSRDLSKAQKALETFTDDKSVNAKPANVEPIQIDMSSDESIQAAVKTVEQKYGHLDILMLNAGIAYISGGTTREQFQKIYDTNVFGTSVTADLFLPLLRKSTAAGGKRIAFTSSGLASLKWAAETEVYNGANYPIYRSTKTAVNSLMVSYARQLEGEGFVVSASDPGYCATNLNNYGGLKDPREGAKALIRAAVADKESVHMRMVDEEQKAPW